jgi:cell division protein FtsW
VSKKLEASSGPWEPRLLGIIAVTLVAFGIIAVYGASSVVLVLGNRSASSYAVGQLNGAFIGVVALLVATRLDYHLWRDNAWPILGLVAFLLLILHLPFASFMTTDLGTQAVRWIDLRVMSFQPSELAKFAVIVWTAMLAAKKGDVVRDFKKGLLPFVVVLGAVALLILFEPDLSTACLVLLLAGVVLFTAGARIGHFMLIGVVSLPFLGGSMMQATYQLQRLKSFLGTVQEHADLGWQIDQSLIGFGAGGLFGVGFGHGLQKLGYLPLAYSDFIFSAIGEEWGFVGVLIMVLVYGLFIVLGFRIARTAPDRFGMLLATGITALIGVTALTHMAVTLALVPTTGLPLPFISHGRSNLVVSLFATGVLINIGNSRFSAKASR